MSEEEETPKVQPEPNWVAADPVLEMLVSATNSMTERVEDGVRLTLMVNGQVVSGVLIPSWQWFEEMHELQYQGTTDSHMSEFAKVFKQAATQRRELMSRDWESLSEDEKSELRSPAMHLCLKDATVFMPSTFPTNGGAPWRIRLSHVSAWLPGLASAE